MITLYDIGLEIQKIREAANSLTVKGVSNASLVVYISNKCNEMIQSINQIADTVDRADRRQRPLKSQNGGGELDAGPHAEKEGGKIDGKPDPGISPSD